MLGEVPVAYADLVDLVLVFSALGQVLADLRDLREGLIVDVYANVEEGVVDVADAHSDAALDQDVAVEARVVRQLVPTVAASAEADVVYHSLAVVSVESELILVAEILDVPDLNLLSLAHRQVLVDVHVNAVDVVERLLGHRHLEIARNLGREVRVFLRSDQLLRVLHKVILLRVLVDVHDRVVPFVALDV